LAQKLGTVRFSPVAAKLMVAATTTKIARADALIAKEIFIAR
jgi:hypothetical protein